MSRLAPIVLVAQPDPTVSAALVGQSQALLLILIFAVIVAIAAVSNAAGVLWSLMTELVEGLWAGVKAIALLVAVLICLVYLLVHGGGPG